MIAPYYAGDAIVMAEENPNLAFSVPGEGTNRFIDSICVLPPTPSKKKAAELYTHFPCASRRLLRKISPISAIPHRNLAAL